MLEEVVGVREVAGAETVEGDYLVASVEQELADMGSQESGTAGDNNSHVVSFTFIGSHYAAAGAHRPDDQDSPRIQ